MKKCTHEQTKMVLSDDFVYENCEDCGELLAVIPQEFIDLTGIKVEL